MNFNKFRNKKCTWRKADCKLKINLINWSSIVMCLGITFLTYYLTNPEYSRSVQKKLNKVNPSPVRGNSLSSLNKTGTF